jgi:ATP-binding cassette subfamily F protein uup
MGIQNADSGLIEPGEKVEFGYYQQKDIVIPPNKRVIDYVRDASEFMHIANGEKISASHLLERFLFPQSQHFVMADTLS